MHGTDFEDHNYPHVHDDHDPTDHMEVGEHYDKPGWCVPEDTCGDDNLEEEEIVCGSVKLGAGMVLSVLMAAVL